MFGAIKGVIRIRISKKNRQHNAQKKKYKGTKNDLQNARLCKLQKGALDSQPQVILVYQLLPHGRWLSPGTPVLPPLKLIAMI